MKREYPISKLEQTFLTGIAFLVSAAFATTIFVEAVQAYNLSVSTHQKNLAIAAGATVISFSGCCTESTPLFHLISFFILFAIWKRRYFGAAIISTIYLLLVLISLYFRYNSFNPEYVQRAPVYELLLYVAGPENLLACAFILLLGIWYSSLLMRFGWNGRSPTLP